MSKSAVIMKRLTVVLLLFACCFTFAGFKGEAEKAKVKVLIIPKFEIGNFSGDFIGEGQLFYEAYTPGAEEIRLPNSSQGTRFFYNKDNGVGLLVTDMGKTAACLSLTALLNCGDYDCSEAMIVSVGCAGGSKGTCTLGDVVLNTAVCDYDLGHRADSTELSDPISEVTWFHKDSYDAFAFHTFNAELTDRVYEMIRDCPLQTTEIAKQVLEHNFPGEAWANREPTVLKGTVVSGDCYWKGEYGHRNAEFIAETYQCPDPYAVTEMEEIAIADTAANYGLLDRVISLRGVVNLDVFLRGETPERLWLDNPDYVSQVMDDNSETLDIFEPAMHNLFDVGKIVIDAVLEGRL